MKRQKSRWIFSHLLKRSSVLSHPFAIPCVVTQPWGKNELWFLSVSLKSKETFFNILKDVSSCSLFFFSLLHSLKEQSLYFHFSLFFHALFASLQPRSAQPHQSILFASEHSQKLFLVAPYGGSQQKPSCSPEMAAGLWTDRNVRDFGCTEIFPSPLSAVLGCSWGVQCPRDGTLSQPSFGAVNLVFASMLLGAEHGASPEAQPCLAAFPLLCYLNCKAEAQSAFAELSGFR